MEVLTLPPIRETREDWDALERYLLMLFKKEIYVPILKELGLKHKMLNSRNALLDAIQSGRIQFDRGAFRGKFDSKISAELRKLGSTWNKSTGSYMINKSKLPIDIRSAISISETAFQTQLKKIDQRLSEILPEQITGKMKMQKIFETSLFKVDKEFHKSIKSISIAPKLTEGQAKRISDEWATNMDLEIKKFSEKQVISLRQTVQANVFTGNRHESLKKELQKSYGVTANKAKFLARQETNLLMAKFKETRYQDAGITEYVWKCVTGTGAHPVRPSHKILEGKIFKWNNPPVTSAPGEPQRRCNPGQDYNCRCTARPIVRFKKGK